MKKAIPFLCGLVLSLMTFTATYGQSRFSLAPGVTVDYRFMNFNYQSAGSGVPFQLTGSGSYHTIGIGLTGYYAFSKHGSVSVGLLFSRFTGTDKISSANGTTLTEGFESGSDNLQLPILVNYTTSSHRLSPYLSAGAVVSHTNVDPVAYYIIGQQTRDDPRVLPDVPPKTVRVQALVGAGVQYRFAPTIALIVQPTATYAFGRPSAGYSQYQVYTLGIQTQLKCTF